MSQFFNNDDIQKAINKVVSLGLDNFMFQEPSSNGHRTSSERCTSSKHCTSSKRRSCCTKQRTCNKKCTML